MLRSAAQRGSRPAHTCASGRLRPGRAPLQTRPMGGSLSDAGGSCETAAAMVLRGSGLAAGARIPSIAAVGKRSRQGEAPGVPGKRSQQAERPVSPSAQRARMPRLEPCGFAPLHGDAAARPVVAAPPQQRRGRGPGQRLEACGFAFRTPMTLAVAAIVVRTGDGDRWLRPGWPSAFVSARRTAGGARRPHLLSRGWPRVRREGGPERNAEARRFFRAAPGPRREAGRAGDLREDRTQRCTDYPDAEDCGPHGRPLLPRPGGPQAARGDQSRTTALWNSPVSVVEQSFLFESQQES